MQRQDGQVVQLSELLNLVLDSAATEKPAPELARVVSEAYGRELTVEGLHHLLDTKLVPLGLIEPSAEDDRPPPRLPKADPLLALRLRGTILPARAVNVVAGILAPIFLPAIVVVALALLVTLDVYLLMMGDALAALEQILMTPALLLALFALLSLGALIHELGHATACRYGGATPGRIGFGLYIVFPAYFTNVTDSYRLDRAGRVRTDLGGLYFNVWCVLAAGAGYLITGHGLLLLVVILMQLQMIQQLPPFIRLDGYFVLADLVGVPDLFSRVGPVARSILPGRATDPRIAELKPAARRIVTIWVVTVVPLLVIALLVSLWMLPLVLTKTVEAISVHAASVVTAWEQIDPVLLVVAVLSIVLLVLPLLGLAVVLVRVSALLVRAATSAVRRLRRARTADDPDERKNGMSTIHRPPTDSTASFEGLDDVVESDAAERIDGPQDVASDEPLVVSDPQLAASDAPVADVGGSAATRASFLWAEPRDPAAQEGWRGFVVRSTGMQLPPSSAERDRRGYAEAVSRRWLTPRTVAVVNGKGGVGKTVTTAMLAAVFARSGGSGVLAWDNNDTRGTLGWRTEKAEHEATIQDLLPSASEMLAPSAQVADLARFVHHQTSDKYDVLRSNPELLATNQRITREDFDALHDVATKYFRVVFFDSGNDESAPRWLRMIDFTDQLVVATTASAESAESGALLLEALRQRDEAGARLASSAVVIVLQSERDGTAAAVRQVADGFTGLARAVVTIPFDPALHNGPLRFDNLALSTQRAWLKAAAAVADGL
ncbi:MinD/ParA family ATP-binding protein [Microbacterium sp.]|uniref:MinD/ParA family ATP-binding protein n=1 Tax=Microbacterium sp. TaxID=51671 RepID=UPI002E375DEB|nr:AAA family ATPase [Microbacterium sp.]HEX5729889.1 AAA family ATPase [Microbacterium sp.]